MKAADVIDALRSRWPDSEYLNIVEAPEDSARQGRKIDLLTISLWSSRGHEIDATEVKVSWSDWTRERDRAAKADWWWRHSDRFWLACPAELAAKVKQSGDLPATWGLLSVEDGKVAVVVKPAKREQREPFTWAQQIGLMRASADAGVSALSRARAAGVDEGYRRGKADAERRNPDELLSNQLDTLRQNVADFEAASGIKIVGGDSAWFGSASRQIGDAVRMMREWQSRPGDLRRNARDLRAQGEMHRQRASTMADLIELVVGPDQEAAVQPVRDRTPHRRMPLPAPLAGGPVMRSTPTPPTREPQHD